MFGIVKIGSKVVSTLCKGAKAMPKTILGAGGAYAGWNFLVHDKGVMETGEEIVLGKAGAEKANSVVSNVGKVAEDVSDAATSISNIVKKGAEAVDNMIPDGSPSGENLNTGGEDQNGGILNSLGNLFGGGNNIFDGVGNMVKGLFSGNFLKPVALIAGLWMMFGRSGWMSKIGGTLMLLMTLGMGGNSQSKQQTADNERSQSQNRTQSPQQTVDEPQRSNGMRM